MTMKYVRDTYGVPAKRGCRVSYSGVTIGSPPLLGTICSATSSGHIRVRFDGERRTLKLHPTWAIKYLPATKTFHQPTETNEQRKG